MVVRKIVGQSMSATSAAIGVGLDIPDGIEQRVGAATLSFAMMKIMAKRPVAKPGSIRVGLDIPDGIEQRVGAATLVSP
jgi:hypothetical protein